MRSTIIDSITLSFSGDSSLRVVFGNGISQELHRRVVAFCRTLFAQRISGIHNAHPSYNTVVLSFDPVVLPAEQLLQYVQTVLHTPDHMADSVPPRKVIPVCYDREFGIDLEEVAAYTRLTMEDVIRTHLSVEYCVYFLGFSPGFPYLGEMPRQLIVPRLPSPRLNVPAGSVAIGGSQTGVYPRSSPGGWRIIGRTPLSLFNPESTPPTFLEMGDRVLFRSISKEEFIVLQQQSQR